MLSQKEEKIKQQTLELRDFLIEHRSQILSFFFLKNGELVSLEDFVVCKTKDKLLITGDSFVSSNNYSPFYEVKQFNDYELTIKRVSKEFLFN